MDAAPVAPDLTPVQIAAILHSFGLPPALHWERLGGWGNQNYWVVTAARAENQEQKEVVIKRLGRQARHNLVNDLAIQQQLQGSGLLTPTYLTDEAGRRTYVEGAGEGEVWAVVSNKLPGVHAVDLGEGFCYAIGQVAGLFHGTVRALPQPALGWLNSHHARAALDQDFAAPHLRAAQQLLADNLLIHERGLTQAVIHGDLHENNVLVPTATDPAIGAMLDFEEAEENVRVVDLARTALSVCRDPSGRSLVRAKWLALLAGYASRSELAEAERAALPDALRYVIGAEVLWLHHHGFEDAAKEHIERLNSVAAVTACA